MSNAVYYSVAGNIVLIRVPKAGSSSAYTAMCEAYRDSMENGDLHETYAELRKRIRSPGFLEQQDWRVIGFVRHPLAWLDSMTAQFWPDCHYAARWFGGGLSRYDGPELTAKILTHMKLTPYDWFTDADGNVRVTEVWRMEDMAAFCKNLDVPYQHGNPTPDDQRKKLEWTPVQLAAIKARFHRELAHYPEGL